MTDLLTDESEFGHNIFLDFLNRDSRQFIGIYRIGQSEQSMLRRALNVAILLTRDVCYFPPGFLAEDEIAREIVREYEAVRDARLVRLPVRESLDDLWAKKEREYASVRGEYSGLFEKEGRRFVEENSHLLIDRPFEIGKNLVKDWESAADNTDSWTKKYLSRFPPGVIEVFRKVPAGLAEDGAAITWRTIASRIPEVAKRHHSYRAVMQHVYFNIYVQNLDLKVLSNIPMMFTGFGLEDDDLFYNYSALEAIAQAAGVWEEVIGMPPEALVDIRRLSEYFQFRDTYRALCQLCANRSFLLSEALAQRQKDRERLLREAPLPPPMLIRDPDLNAIITSRLLIAAQMALETESEANQRRKSLGQLVSSIKKGGQVIEGPAKYLGKNGKQLIAFYAPLAEERRIFVKGLKLEPVSDTDYIWRGGLAAGLDMLLYSSPLMGRVPATARTCRLLRDFPVLDAIIVVGFAGGFSESKVEHGNVLVPRIVADLAARKIGSASANENLIRPDPYKLDARLQGWLETHFQEREWASKAADYAEWPDGRHPSLKMGGTIICGDEVVANDAHRAKLLKAWPHALGVEMECGGVAAACEVMSRNIPVFQIRVVTDMADPLKTDDQWRKIGAKTLSSLISAIDWSEVLAAP